MDDTLRAQDKILLIDQLPLFSDLTPPEKELIAKSSILVEFKKGDVVYREGEPGEAFYCVVTGRLKACVRTALGAEAALEYLKRGKYFGLISLLTKEPHSVTVKVVNDAILLKIPKEEFEAVIRTIPRLALRLSLALSRRAKRTDLHEKKIFETSIISVYGRQERLGKSTYALNLGVCLKRETAKRVVLLSVSKTGRDIADMLALGADMPRLVLNTPFFEEKDVKASICRGPDGIDIINIPHLPDDSGDITHIIPLLSYLTNDYHYIIVDLPPYMDRTVFETLKQSDMIHLLVPSDKDGLESARALLDELKSSSAAAVEKLKVITAECATPSSLPFEEKIKLLGHDIFATLPLLEEPPPKGPAAKPVVLSDPTCGYSKVVRRISRQIGEVLVGLALGSGAALGLAHIGVLKVIEREKIPIDTLAGTSMGALIGGLWASGMAAPDIERAIAKFSRRMESLKLIDLTFPARGLIKGRVVRSFLRSLFGRKTFYDLKLPFKVVACDIATREEVVIDRGSVVDAIMASVSIPGVFEPVRSGERMLVDGGIINPLPANVLMRLGVSKIIAVNTLPSPEDVREAKKRRANIFDILVNTFQAGEFILAEVSGQNADILMHPVIPAVGWYEFYEMDKIIDRGEQEAKRCLSKLKEMVLQA